MSICFPHLSQRCCVNLLFVIFMRPVPCKISPHHTTPAFYPFFFTGVLFSTSSSVCTNGSHSNSMLPLSSPVSRLSQTNSDGVGSASFVFLTIFLPPAFWRFWRFFLLCFMSGGVRRIFVRKKNSPHGEEIPPLKIGDKFYLLFFGVFAHAGEKLVKKAHHTPAIKINLSRPISQLCLLKRRRITLLADSHKTKTISGSCVPVCEKKLCKT